MLRSAVFVLALSAALLSPVQAAPPVTPKPPMAEPEPSEPVFAPATISSETYEPKTTIGGDAAPACQIKIGPQWTETRTATLDECATQLDQKAPVQARPMSTAYWNEHYLAADDKNIYQADGEASAWSVLRPRAHR
ncbi:hypothetical protein [Solimonas flava]|uniref:hypothetical protein n=1 Tax=Solimonas flava TaxID=415849 RepID=UPI000481CAFF|nr:hypothetical protein [Solimonas flava]